MTWYFFSRVKIEILVNGGRIFFSVFFSILGILDLFATAIVLLFSIIIAKHTTHFQLLWCSETLSRAGSALKTVQPQDKKISISSLGMNFVVTLGMLSTVNKI